jgi:hypothetical protein
VPVADVSDLFTPAQGIEHPNDGVTAQAKDMGDPAPLKIIDNLICNKFIHSKFSSFHLRTGR